jgi:hypothetical protein
MYRDADGRFACWAAGDPPALVVGTTVLEADTWHYVACSWVPSSFPFLPSVDALWELNSLWSGGEPAPGNARRSGFVASEGRNVVASLGWGERNGVDRRGFRIRENPEDRIADLAPALEG